MGANPRVDRLRSGKAISSRLVSGAPLISVFAQNELGFNRRTFADKLHERQYAGVLGQCRRHVFDARFSRAVDGNLPDDKIWRGDQTMRAILPVT